MGGNRLERATWPPRLRRLSPLYLYVGDFAVLYQSAFRWRNFILNKFPQVVFVTRPTMNLYYA
jgi:hypothetical protein